MNAGNPRARDPVVAALKPAGLPLRAFVVAMFINTLWGANPVAVKIGLEAFPPLTSAFIRFLIGAICVACCAMFLRKSLRPVTGELRVMGMLSAIFAVQVATMNIGFDLTTGVMGVIGLNTFPLFSALFAHFFIAGDRLTPMKTAGLTIAFLGVGSILLRNTGFGDMTLAGIGNWVVVFSASLLAARLIFTARLVENIDPVRLMFWQMVLALPVFLTGAVSLETVDWSTVGWRPIGGIAYQGVVIAGFAFLINAHLMKRYSPSVITSFGFVSPVAGVLLSIWLLSETLPLSAAVGMVAVATGLLLTARSGGERATAARK